MPGTTRDLSQALYVAAVALGRTRDAEEVLGVLQLVAEGKTTKEISAILGVSVKTADAHRTRLMQKLNIHDIAGLTRYAIRHGLIQP